MQFWPPDDEHVFETCRGMKYTYCKTKTLCIMLVNYWDKLFSNLPLKQAVYGQRKYSNFELSTSLTLLHISLKILVTFLCGDQDFCFSSNKNQFQILILRPATLTIFSFDFIHLFNPNSATVPKIGKWQLSSIISRINFSLIFLPFHTKPKQWKSLLKKYNLNNKIHFSLLEFLKAVRMNIIGCYSAVYSQINLSLVVSCRWRQKLPSKRWHFSIRQQDVTLH